MSQVRVFSLVGDSNVKIHMSPINCRDRPAMVDAQVIPCTKLAVFQQCLRSVRATSDVCIVSCVSNFVADSESSTSSMSQRLDPVYKEFFTKLIEACNSNPHRTYFVCPPMFRKTPVWYRSSMPEILTSFSSSFVANVLGVTNLFAFPSFPTPVFEDDGVHLNPYSGLEFVLYLFDSAKTLLSSINSSTEARQVQNTESIRTLEDRMMAVEQGYKCLASDFDLKCAVDSELACFRENERNEDSFLISGLSQIPASLSGREWQERAKHDVKRVVLDLINKEINIVVVRNVSSRAGSFSSYSVQLDSIQDSRLIRSKFGSFFARGVDNRPLALKDISISNVVTRATRIRISLLKLFAKKYRDSNANSKTLVVGYEPRPLLKLTPPPETKQRVKTLTFIEAVKTLPRMFSSEELDPILRAAKAGFPGRLRSLFVVISDDMIKGSKPSRGSKRFQDSADSDERPSQVARTDS